MTVEPIEAKLVESFAEKQILWFKLLLADAPARGRVVAKLCVEGKLDLESGIDLILDAEQTLSQMEITR